MCPLLEKGASSSLFFSALFMSVQAPCLKIGAWPTPVTAGGAIAAAAKAALCPSAARVRCGGGSIQIRFIILLCASFKRIVLKHSAAQVIVVMLGGGNWAEEAQVNGNHGHGLLFRNTAPLRFDLQPQSLHLAPKRRSVYRSIVYPCSDD